MITRLKLLRRHLLAASVVGASAWLSQPTLLAAADERPSNLVAYDALIMLSIRLQCTPEIGEACLLALPAPMSIDGLAASILRDTRTADRTFASLRAFSDFINECIQEDYRYGKIVVVDGWMFSLIETHLYALASQTAH